MLLDSEILKSKINELIDALNGTGDDFNNYYEHHPELEIPVIYDASRWVECLEFVANQLILSDPRM